MFYILSKKNINDAKSNGSIDEGRLKVDERIQRSKIIFICTPVSVIDQIASSIFPFLAKDSIVTDVGSVKNCFSKKTIKLFSRKSFLVPSHPIAGTEHSGAKSAKVNLFEKKWCIITPLKKKSFQNSNKYQNTRFPKISKIHFPGLGTLREVIWTTYYHFFVDHVF